MYYSMPQTMGPLDLSSIDLSCPSNDILVSGSRFKACAALLANELGTCKGRLESFEDRLHAIGANRERLLNLEGGFIRNPSIGLCPCFAGLLH